MYFILKNDEDFIKIDDERFIMQNHPFLGFACWTLHYCTLEKFTSDLKGGILMIIGIYLRMFGIYLNP